ncbi:hypothetical protein GPECTOR_62g886 [Gonium pectorale]|uniref:Protein kinase domain-containing protein n=1 Tax=Gonium pectorale TaxID=33097 RepID=A0A150G4M2_GONPE|nr:hypothetical protein GPECTOR_62g886 [Gonium pectorale]|eukprot:KXZ44771.1 hypothetical protein GPECTOR_62g886 [Gonium pectorale]
MYGCPGTTIDTNFNWTRHSILVAAGGTLTLQGLRFTNTPLMNQLFWPRFLAPLLGLVDVSLGGGCYLNSCSISSPATADLAMHLSSFHNNTGLSEAAKPTFNVVNGSSVTIARWRLTGEAVWHGSPGVPVAVAAASFWDFTNVSVTVMPPVPCRSSLGVQGIKVSTGYQLRQLIGDPDIPALEIVNNVTLLASEWPPEASGPATGQLFVNKTKEIYACHPEPGQRYTINWGDLGQVVFVFGTLRIRGSLLLTNPRASPRRSWLYLLVGALSVETDGVILFEGVEIHSNTSSPFTNAADPFWAIQCGPLCSSFIPSQADYRNISYYDAFIYYYEFMKTDWVAVSQGRNITGTGFWGYTDVALTWRPDEAAEAGGGGGDGVPTAAIAVPVAVGGALLVAVVVGWVLWVRRRRSDEAAKSPYHTSGLVSMAMASGDSPAPGNQQSGVSGAPGRGSSGKEGTSPPGSSSAGPPAVTSTLFSAGSTMVSGTTFTEARIEDMKRAITSQANQASMARNEQITLTELLGEGTFGKVYRGTWRGTTVAVKTMVLPTNMSGQEKREKMAVMETAISSSLSHPNIVQTYTYAVLPVKGDGAAMDGIKLGTGTSLTMESTSPLAAATSAEYANVHSWEVRLVLEFCDRGSLRDVLNEATLAASLTPKTNSGGSAQPGGDPAGAAAAGQGAGRVAAPAQLADGEGGDAEGAAPAATGRATCPMGYADVLGVSLDVARAMLHMHSENIVHGGTITHMAPEVLLHGKVSKASDVYAFAILMWEAYTAGQAFKGTPRALLGHEVTKMNRRPQFPADTPFEFQLLACRCWESDASIRPTFEQIVEELTRMRAKQAAGPGSALTPAQQAAVASGPFPDHGSGSLAAASTSGPSGMLYSPGAGGMGGPGMQMLPVVPSTPLQYQSGAAATEQPSVTLNSETGGMYLGASAVNAGLFVVQGVDGSSMGTMGLPVTPGTGSASAGFTMVPRAADAAGRQGHGPPLPAILETPNPPR